MIKNGPVAPARHCGKLLPVKISEFKNGWKLQKQDDRKNIPMKFFKETNFPGLAVSRSEKFFLRIAEANERSRKFYLIVAIFWTAFRFLSGLEGFFIVLMIYGNWIMAFFGYFSHALLQILRRQIAMKESLTCDDLPDAGPV